MNQASTTVRRRRLLSINAYAAGDMFGGAINQLTSLYYLPFLILVVGMRPALAGAVIAFGRIWDGLNDPIMGAIVDRTRTRFGSCRPFFLIAILPIFLGNVLIWSAWGIQGETAQFAYFALANVFYTTASTIGLVPYDALLPKLADGYKERRNYTSFRPFYATITCVAVTYLYEAVVPATQNNPLSAAFQSNFTRLGILTGIIYTIPLVITFLGTKEKNITPLLETEKQPIKQTVKKVFSEYKEVLQNKTYRKYFYIVLLGAFVSACVLSSMAFLVYVIYGNIESYLLGFTLLFVVVNFKGAFQIAFDIPNVIMAHKKNKHTPLLVDIPLLMVSSAMILFITPSTPVWLFITAMCFLGAGISCLRFVSLSLLPDLSDVYELMYGRRAEGINAGLNTLGRQLTEGLTIALCGFVLGMFGIDSADLNFNPDKVLSGAITVLKIMYGILPLIACGVIIVIAKTYRLDGKRHDMIKALINEKREKGFAVITSEQETEIEKITGKKYKSLWIAGNTEGV